MPVASLFVCASCEKLEPVAWMTNSEQTDLISFSCLSCRVRAQCITEAVSNMSGYISCLRYVAINREKNVRGRMEFE